MTDGTGAGIGLLNCPTRCENLFGNDVACVLDGMLVHILEKIEI